MFNLMVEASQQHIDGLITAGELRHKLAKAILDNELSVEVMEDKEFTCLAYKLIS